MSNTSTLWKLTELLSRAGIEKRAFRQMRSAGAVDPPWGTTRGARYGFEHLAQIKRVLFVEQRRGLSRSAACEFVSNERKVSPRSPAVQSKNRAAATLSFTGTVRRLMPEVFLVYSKKLPGFERQLIDEATDLFRKANRELASAKSVSSSPYSTIYRANRKVSRG